ncbi:UNVERIFIED_CONTAM: hypothetical protein FKN15_032062 [Acipenser sinensis]
MGDGVMAAVQGFVSGAWWWSDLRTGSPDHAVVAAPSSQLVSAGTETSMPLHYQTQGLQLPDAGLMSAMGLCQPWEAGTVHSEAGSFPLRISQPPQTGRQARRSVTNTAVVINMK